MDLEGLNPPQREAVLHPGGPLVVFAGAGSGKTRVITHRVARLVAEVGVPPWRVLAVTFTNKAAGEMRERLHRLLPAGGAGDLWMGTFHAVCARLLRRYSDAVGVRRDFTIYDDSDQKAMVSRVVRDLGFDERRYPPKLVAGRINRAKQEVVGPEDFSADDPWTEIVRRIYEAYEHRMEQCGALDFGDLIYRLVVALEVDASIRGEIAGRYSHVLVDEFQDTNHAQLRLVHALAERHRNLCVVGDDDQSIYRWRGADRRNILDFREHYPDATVIKLEQNYRSTQRILRVAHAVISRNLDREPKRLWTDNEEGPKVLVVRCEDERDEARMIVQAVRELQREDRAYADAVVFYRTHAQSRVIEEALRASNIPYRVVGGMRFYDRSEVKDLLAYLRVLHNPDDDVSLLRIVNTPTRGIGKTTIERLLDQAAGSGVGVWEAIRRAPDNPLFKAGVRKRLAAFEQLLSELRTESEEGAPLVDLAEAVLERTGYHAMLHAEDTPEADARTDNIRELLGSISEFQEEAEEPSLASFLELVTLQTSADEADEQDRVTLMTIHAAKGLEFPVVLVAGLEEQLFPLRGADALEDPQEIEEERRLAYVAFTRAEQRLVLSWAGIRRIYGQMRVGRPSRFIRELPPEDVEELGVRVSPEAQSGYRAGRVGGLRGGGYGPMPAAAGVVPRDADEPYIDYSEGSDVHAEGPHVGMQVRHPKFGVGRVRSLTDGVPPRVEVEFPGWGTKRIVLTYLEPA